MNCIECVKMFHHTLTNSGTQICFQAGTSISFQAGTCEWNTNNNQLHLFNCSFEELMIDICFMTADDFDFDFDIKFSWYHSKSVKMKHIFYRNFTPHWLPNFLPIRYLDFFPARHFGWNLSKKNHVTN